MARFDRLTVYNTMLDLGVVPLFYNPDVEVSRQVIAACAAGGAKVVEFTNRGDFAPQVYLEVARHFAAVNPDIILGVGSVVDAPTAALYISYGAHFVVAPNLNPEVARLCNRRKIAYLPGCATASEIAQAEELGVEIVKIFPGNTIGGPSFVKAVLGPCPWTRILPSGGVEPTEESLKAWFDAGAACVGMGSNLITKETLKNKDFAGLTAKVSETLAIIRKVRGRTALN
jgi:2-dehydro-3-deoxyphosphogluconate aldolase / (4S)-4-hydroxy-2-oxoglutarate aldolase